jgi:hypothetical protein
MLGIARRRQPRKGRPTSADALSRRKAKVGRRCVYMALTRLTNTCPPYPAMAASASAFATTSRSVGIG